MCEGLLGYVYLFYLWIGLDLSVLSFDSNRSLISCETLFLLSLNTALFMNKESI